MFAPAPSTISFVPLTRNLSLADSSPYPVRGWTGLSEATATRFPVLRTTKCDAFSEAHRTKNRLLRYGICVPCSKRLPGVRDAFSEAFGVKNRLLRYGRDIRCQKQPSLVRDASSKAHRTADSTECGQPPGVRNAFSEACRAKSSLLPHRTHLQCAKRPSLGSD